MPWVEGDLAPPALLCFVSDVLRGLPPIGVPPGTLAAQLAKEGAIGAGDFHLAHWQPSSRRRAPSGRVISLAAPSATWPVSGPASETSRRRSWRASIAAPRSGQSGLRSRLLWQRLREPRKERGSSRRHWTSPSRCDSCVSPSQSSSWQERRAGARSEHDLLGGVSRRRPVSGSPRRIRSRPASA
jgi:hypothetical protein